MMQGQPRALSVFQQVFQPVMLNSKQFFEALLPIPTVVRLARHVFGVSILVASIVI